MQRHEAVKVGLHNASSLDPLQADQVDEEDTVDHRLERREQDARCEGIRSPQHSALADC